MSFILETENLSKHYKGQKANDQISLHVPESSIYGLLGPNGAGKPTFQFLLTMEKEKLEEIEVEEFFREINKVYFSAGKLSKKRASLEDGNRFQIQDSWR